MGKHWFIIVAGTILGISLYMFVLTLSEYIALKTGKEKNSKREGANKLLNSTPRLYSEGERFDLYLCKNYEVGTEFELKDTTKPYVILDDGKLFFNEFDSLTIITPEDMNFFYDLQKLLWGDLGNKD